MISREVEKSKFRNQYMERSAPDIMLNVTGNRFAPRRSTSQPHAKGQSLTLERLKRKDGFVLSLPLCIREENYRCEANASYMENF